VSAENVQLARRSYDHFIGTGDPIWDLWSPDIVWDMSTFRGWPEDPVYQGRDGFERFMRNWLEPFDEWTMEVEDLIGVADRVVAVLRQYGKARGGTIVDMHFAHVLTFRDGKITRASIYADVDEALAAAGVGGRS
jgi:ketosteroid isomerase-like protein